MSTSRTSTAPASALLLPCIENRIIVLRGSRVMIDADLAAICDHPCTPISLLSLPLSTGSWELAARYCPWKSRPTQNISLHLKNIFQDRELDPAATVKESLTVQIEGSRRVGDLH